MPELVTIPAFRLLICCLLGYGVAHYMDLTHSDSVLLACCLVGFIGCLTHYLLRKPGMSSPYATLVFCLLLVFSFVIRYSIKETGKIDFEDLSTLDKFHLNFLESSQKGQVFEHTFYLNSRTLKYKKVLLYSKEKILWKCGDNIEFRGQLREFEKPVFKDQFDYSKYMENNGIVASGFINKGEFTLLCNTIGLREWPFLFKDRLLQSINKNIKNTNIKAIAQSLILGHKKNLNKALRKKFVENGVMHVLAISGMHMGVLAGLILFLLRKLLPYRKQKPLVLLITIGLLSAYCAITGFPASAVRALVMISLFLIGKTIMVSQSSFNIIFFTALVMLIYDPNLMFDIGFQLSFMAVLSIVYFYPILTSFMSFENEILRIIWSLVSVGVSAQIGTFGISLYYFDTFSPWFWLLGIPASILSSLGMVLGMLMFFAEVISSIAAYYFGVLLEGILQFFLYILDIAYSLSWHHFENIFWTNLNLCLYYSAAISLAYYFHTRSFRTLVLSLTFILTISIVQLNDRLKKNTAIEICELNIDAKKAFEIHYNNTAVLINPDLLPTSEISLCLKTRRKRNRIKRHINLPMNKEISVNQFLSFRNNKIYLRPNTKFNYIRGYEVRKIMTNS